MKTLDFGQRLSALTFVLHNRRRCESDQNEVEKTVVATQLKHLDIMCQTLERQIDVLSHVHRVIPSQHESVYSGDPDSLDGTSSELMMMGDDDDNDEHENEDHPLRRRRSLHFTINQNLSSSSSSSPLPFDPMTMLQLERSAHLETRQELSQLKKRFEVLRDEFDSGEGMSETTSLLFNNQLDTREFSKVGSEDVKTLFTSSQNSRRPESVTEITKLHNTLVQLERVRDELTLQNLSLKTKLGEISARISESPTYRQDKLNNNSPPEEDGHARHVPDGVKSVDPPPPPETDEMKLKRKSTYKVSHPKDESGTEINQLRSLIKELQSKEGEALRQVAQSGSEVKLLRTELENVAICKREAERGVRLLEGQLIEIEKRLEATEQCFLTRDEENSALKLDLDTLKEENGRLREQLHQLHHQVEREQCKGVEKLSHFEREISLILDENKNLREEVGRERLLRKRYYNIVEELKGKIRVFCRIKPLCGNEKGNNKENVVAKCSDPYTVTVETSKGVKEFQFDRVFLPDASQEQVFSDTRNLIQSAFDGFNVCCVSYGQTGSGKSYTILGDEKQPGIAPRTFNEIFSLAADLKHSFDTKISFYILELYNDKLIDLLNPHSYSPSSHPMDSPDMHKLEIKRDRSGTVWISGARVLVAESSGALEKSFRHAVGGRHTATTRMNDRSSRSHLIIGLIIETTSRNNGSLLRGKITLLDLAGSERTGKSGVCADTLKEANAINKSLSALGDVINALNTDQPFVPYRNNKLTLLMQDSIGGNAKTLMFVNISPVGSNVDETIVSLTYAARVKQVTNGATRNAESKEVARLRNLVTRLKRGDQGSAEDETL